MRKISSLKPEVPLPPKRKRVAAYARVSTDTERLMHSLSAQVSYYSGLIQGNPEWEYAGVYADCGVSGTSIARRAEFQRLLADCEAGGIDIVLTKSISRFARNTLDLLEIIRHLKELGVEVRFEKENINSLSGDGELMLTLLASFAQEESRSISENIKWSIRKRFEAGIPNGRFRIFGYRWDSDHLVIEPDEAAVVRRIYQNFLDGKYSLAYSRFLGYDRGEDGGLVINEEQAETVRLIYWLFLEGYTPHRIARELTERKILTPGGATKWSPSTVGSILTNEKYKGDALLQKSYTPDFLTKKQVANQGEVKQYYVEDDHPAIINPEVFDMVQQELMNRRNSQGRYSGVDRLAAKLRCGQCGGSFGPKVWHSNSKYRRVVYQCNGKYKHGCTTPHVDEQQIEALFVTAVNELLAEKGEIIANLRVVLDTLCGTEGLEKERQGLCGELSVLVGLMEGCIAENARIAQDQEAYQRRYDELTARYEAAKERLETIQDAISDRTAQGISIVQFIKTLEQQDGMVTEFDNALWGSLLDHAEIFEKGKVRFCFKNGIAL